MQMLMSSKVGKSLETTLLIAALVCLPMIAASCSDEPAGSGDPVEVNGGEETGTETETGEGTKTETEGEGETETETTDTTTDAGTQTPAASDEVVEIKFELPKPIFVGTPPQDEIPDYVEIIPENRPKFTAPADVTNVALDKPVSAKEVPFIGELDQITDGDKEATDGSYVILGFDPQWVQIDLEAEQEIFGMLVWFYHADPRHFRDVVIQVSNDPDFVDGVTTLFNNDRDNSSGLGVGEDKEYFEEARGRLFDFSEKPVKARYVRITSNGSNNDDQNYHTEIEVYGRPAK